ncbi:Uncharacterized membrane protein [Cetobacterium ceti]|uniref:Uncharacterized membrane protein n=1 Tax=Cetobacterium ceti TaxID=180163 RepID=A0A1T4MB78_9FUSO|nr:DUF819 family protein [Cetobacterium ceti]SJZ64106.1 Uncharacterized membrane protein [Cetobacterium ceti]
MITNVYSYFSLLILFITGILYCQKTLKLSIFKFIPGLTFIYFGGMIGASLHIWKLNSEISSFIGSLKYYLLPMMLFLLLLKNDIRDVFKLGPKLIGTFFAVTASILIGFIIVYVFFKHKLDPEAWQTFVVFLEDGSQALTYAFLMDNICASFWLVLLITFAPMREKFNKFSGANSKEIDKIISRMHFNAAKNEDKRDYEFMDFMLTLGLGLGIAGIVLVIGKQLINPGNLVDGSFLKPLRTFFSGSGWVVIVATVFGLLGSMTPLKKIKGTDHVGNVLLYIVVGLIATATDFSTISFEDAAIYIIGGFLILLFHLIVLLILAKIFKLDLYICGIASQANIGGTVSAPILAGTYDDALIPAGLMMGILGTAIGTIIGLLLAKILILL